MKQELISEAVDQGRIEWSAHVLQRILEQGISREGVMKIISTGEMIENYPDDRPFPSGLFYGLWQEQPLHVVIAYDSNHHKVFLITAYWPDEEHFEADFKTRRRK